MYKKNISLFFIHLSLVLFMVSFQNCGTRFESNLNLSGSSNQSSVDELFYVSLVKATEAIADGTDSIKVEVYIVNADNSPAPGIVPKINMRGDYQVKVPCTESNGAGLSYCEISSVVAGERTLTVSHPSAYSVPIVFKPGAPAEIKVIAGNGQTANTSSPVLIAPRIKVVDSKNNVISNLNVKFSASGDGSISLSSTMTDQDGEASPGQWRLGSAEGANTLNVSAGRLSAKFSAEALNPVTNPLRIVYLPNGSCSTGKIEVYVQNSPHPKYQFINSGECIELDDSVATKSLKVRCVDPSGDMLPSDFVGPAVTNSARSPASSCSKIHKS